MTWAGPLHSIAAECRQKRYRKEVFGTSWEEDCMKQLPLTRWRHRMLAGIAVSTGMIVLAGASPVGATAAASGSGTLNGTMSYTVGNIPADPLGCSAGATWTFSSTSSTAAVLNLRGDFYVGGLSVAGTGVTNCDGFALGQGNLSGWSISTGSQVISGSSVSCPTMGGRWVRAGVIAVYQLGGICSVNQVNDGQAQFAGAGEWTPQNINGTSTSATLSSNWVIAAAQG